MCPAGANFVYREFRQWKQVGPYYNSQGYSEYLKNKDIICAICRVFINLQHKSKGYSFCPCQVLGHQRAIDRTLDALKLKKSHKLRKKFKK
jgi:hypothetical protein